MDAKIAVLWTTVLLVVLVIANACVYACRMRAAKSSNVRVMRVRLSRLSPVRLDAVPRLIWQTYHKLDLPPVMKSVSQSLKDAHPDFRYILMDDALSRAFILEHFGERAARAYETLIPGAFKADLWRYCVLYKFGGVYLDIKYKLVPPFTFYGFTHGLHLVQDLPHEQNTVFNAFMVCPPGEPRLLAAIDAVIENVEKQVSVKSGLNCLAITGPQLLGRFFNRHDPVIDMIHDTTYRKDAGCIYMKNASGKAGQLIIKCARGYSSERAAHELADHYSKLCKQGKLYKNAFIA